MRKAVFLDRDGVLNQLIFRSGKPQAPYTLEEFELLQGVIEGIALLKEHDYFLVVVTNQPDVKRGWVSRQAVDEVNERILKLLPVDDLKVCFHTEEDRCTCRKPAPGMLVNAAQEWGINTSNSFMIGDRSSDIEAGKNAGCKGSILIGSSDGKFKVKPDYECDNLLLAARYIIKHN